MHGPPVVGWLLALLCAAAGGSCLARGGRGVEGADHARIEAVMGLGMAAMAWPGGTDVPPAEVFVALFGALAAWSAWSVRPAGRREPAAHGRYGHGLHHTLEALAMAYMGLVMLGADGGSRGHHGTVGGVPAVTGGLLAYFAAFALCTGARLLPAAAAAGAPGTPDVCRLTLALGSFTMLLTM
jgi:hypothetical protein